MIDAPPQVIKGHWCPTCGRFEIANYNWHVRAGSISDRCDQLEMMPVRYGIALEDAAAVELERMHQ